MESSEITRRAKSVALEHGADLVGVVRVQDLPEHEREISRILPAARDFFAVEIATLSIAPRLIGIASQRFARKAKSGFCQVSVLTNAARLRGIR